MDKAAFLPGLWVPWASPIKGMGFGALGREVITAFPRPAAPEFLAWLGALERSLGIEDFMKTFLAGPAGPEPGLTGPEQPG